LEDLIAWAEDEMKSLGDAFDKSGLPEEVPTELINETLIKIRKEFYEDKK